MKRLPRLNIVASLACIALFTYDNSAIAGLTVTTANQNGPAPFTPTWIPASDSLISGLAPSSVYGSFDQGTGGHVAQLTAGGSLTIIPGSITNYEACGNSAGSALFYTLPASVNGYNITNIALYSGWQDNGRDGQSYTVLYSTVGSPGNFIWLTNVSYTVSGAPGNTPSANRVTIADALGLAIATNVYAVEFDFSNPQSENGWTGFGAITVEGTAAASIVPPVISITTSNQTGSNPFAPTWTAETPNLIAGQSPSSTIGAFNNESTVGTPVLTDGAIGASGDESGFASCGSGGGSVLVYSLNSSANGSDVTNIVVYSGWGDSGRMGQYYNLSYSTVSAPSTFIPLTTVYYLPQGLSGAVANRVAVSTPTGAALAKNVASIKFDFGGPPFASQFNNAWQGYSEIIVQGTDSAPPTIPPSPYLTQDTLPAYAETVIGDQIVFSAAFSNSPPSSVQWLVITNGVTNNINAGVATVSNNGVTTSTLTLNNVQLTDSGSYQLMAVNATNSAAAPSYSTAAILAVGSLPAAVNNVIVSYAGQTFSGTANYFPNWPVDTNNDLILGTQQGSGPGTFSASSGDFSGGGTCYGDPTILSDGIAGAFPSTPSQLFVAGGVVDYGTGYSMTYTLNTGSAPNGFDLTNVTVFGGWPNADHNEQGYQILYATAAAPTSFVPVASVLYNPTDANALPTITRTALIPAAGVALAHNVVAVEINWNSPRPKNGWDAYSEITVQGIPSTGVWPTLAQDVTPQTAMDVVGGQIVVSAAFANATSLQWQLNGINVPGETASTLTLNNLQLTNSGSYTLVASNSVGNASSSGCMIMVNPVSAPTNNAIISIAAQTENAPTFTATWDTSALPNSLIYNLQPSSYGLGSFTIPDGNGENANGPEILTDGAIGTWGQNNSMVTCMGSDVGAGNFVVYYLIGSANGYNLTNITTYGGWANSGRDQQAYATFYATALNPTNFIPLASVNYTPPNPVGISLTRATITPAAGLLASNVVALMFDMRSAPSLNGYEGYSEFGVFGSPSANPDPSPVLITGANENADSPDWMIETNSLIENQLPSSVGSGSFNLDGAGGISVLTDGTFGSSIAGFNNFAMCGGASGAGASVTYVCTNGSWNITNIVVYSGWTNYNQGGQFYDITYSTLSAPAIFVPLASVNYAPDVFLSPNVPTGSSANRVDISPANGTMLATNVYAVTFDFTPQQSYMDNGYSGYAEIVLQGTALAGSVAPKFNSPYISNGNLILTGSGGLPANGGYTLLTTTNLSLPNWTISATGALDGTGAFSNAIPVSGTDRARFFRLELQ